MRNHNSNKNSQQNVTLKPGSSFVDYLVVDINIEKYIGFSNFYPLRHSENDNNTQAERVPFLSKNDAVMFKIQ